MPFKIYHAILRSTALVFAIMIIFSSGWLHPYTSRFSEQTISLIATSIGVTVGVAPNELNVITAQLTEKERQLALREAQLNEREISLGSMSGDSNGQLSLQTYLLATFLFVILLLIILNYILDYQRSRRMTYS